MSEFRTLLAELPMKHQRLIEAYSKLGVWSHAAKEVGVSDATARRVKKTAEASGLLRALTDEIAGQCEIDVEEMIRRFEVIRDEAREAKQFTPAVKAEENIARLAGLIDGKQQLNVGAMLKVELVSFADGPDSAAEGSSSIKVIDGTGDVEVTHPDAAEGVELVSFGGQT